MRRALLALIASLLQRNDPSSPHGRPRLVVIRRHRLGDMLYTLPLLHALRRGLPQAHLAVACDPPGAPIVRACGVVDQVIVLGSRWSRWISLLNNATRLQGFDVAVAAKGGFDLRLATLARLTNAGMRIGFEPPVSAPSAFYTHPVSPPPDPHAEHQIETLFRLLAPLNLSSPTFQADMLRLTVPAESRDFARRLLEASPFAGSSFALINISCNRPVQFGIGDYEEIIRHFLDKTSLAVGIVSAEPDRATARELAGRFSTGRVAAVATPGALDLAALLESASLFLTPEGGAAHLSSATQTPTVVLWSGHYGKWRPRGERHVLVEAAAHESAIPVDRVWQAAESLMAVRLGSPLASG